VISGTQHADLPIGNDPSRVGSARREAAQAAMACGFGEVEAGRLAIVVTELATNLLRHATGGRLLLAARPDRREVEVIALDDGPGMPDVARSLGDGYSTSGTPGTGLGAVRRLATDFDIHSSVPGGTLVLARIRAEGAATPARQALQVGAISIAKPGEPVSGDGWACVIDGHRATLLVADGLGHGPDAAEAAQLAIQAFLHAPSSATPQLLARVHERLRGSRGAAVAMVQVDGSDGSGTLTGAGNVVGRIVSGVEDRTLLTQHGTAGVRIRTPEEVRFDWPPHALIAVCTDGVETRWKSELLHPVLGHDPSLVAAMLVRQHSRGRDDTTVAVLRRRPR